MNSTTHPTHDQVRERPRVVVTTSWDDGHVLDHRLADLLDRYGVEGTFYVSPEDVEIPERERLSPAGTAELAARFEIGGHTRHHIRLTQLTDATAQEEIVSGKAMVEDSIGTALTAFCYPGGAYGQPHPGMVEEAGFVLGRTVERWRSDLGAPYEMPTSVNAYRHLVDGAQVLRLAHGNPARAARYFWNWDDLAIAAFEALLSAGSGCYHFWGHSWEIDDHDDWERLERVLAHIGGRPEVDYLDNTAAFELERSR
jgi:peptidoglycan/xylan/chitin deacetylase (PgdA/CDA1 family)